MNHIDTPPFWLVLIENGIRCNRCTQSIECDGSENWYVQIERFIEQHSECPEKGA